MRASRYPHIYTQSQAQSIKQNNYLLYQPLKLALQESTVYNNQHNHSLQKTLSMSKSKSLLASNIKSFQPKEVQLIKRNLFIPIDKELIPTNHLERVRGMSFSIINCKQKVGEPITEEQFMKRMNQKETTNRTEIVYELLQDKNAKLLSTSDVVNDYRTSAYRPISTFNAIQRSNNGTGYNGSFHERVQSKQLKLNNQTNGQQFQQTRQPINPFRPKINSQLLYTSQSPLQNKQEESYRFKRQLLKYEIGTKQQRLKKQKYNLFSLIDLGGNEDCGKSGCCGANEFIAPRLNNSDWY